MTDPVYASDNCVDRPRVEFMCTRDVKPPTRGTRGSAGVDFYTPNDMETITLAPGCAACIPSGVKVNFPEGYALVAFNKSGIALNRELIVGACVVDSDYEGEIHLHVFNAGNLTQTIEPGTKLVQFLALPVPSIEWSMVASLEYEGSERGTGGFGSTGVS